MRRFLILTLLFVSVKTFGQFYYPTDFYWMFLNGLHAGNYGNLHISADGDIDTIKGNAYDFPDSLRVASAGSRYYLTGTYSGGQYDLDWRRPTKADISALTPENILFGAANGSVQQSDSLKWEVGLLGDGKSLSLYNNGLDASDRISLLLSASGGSSDIYAVTPTNATIQWYSTDFSKGWVFNSNMGGNASLNITGISDERLGLRLGLGSTAQKDFHLVADTIRFEGLDGTGTFLGIDASGDVTKTTVTGFGDVFKVGTPVNNQIGVWTGDGTIEGEASLTYDATAGFDLANSFDAQWSTTGSGTLITANLSNASATGKLIDLQHDEVTKFQVTYTGSTVIGKTSVDAVHALKAGQLGVGATGDVFQMANSGGNTTTFSQAGKVNLYATETPANGEILIGDGVDMELATITAGTGITVTNAAGSITIAETNEVAGEYTPTAASVTNVASIGTVYGHYYRDGDYVHVFVYTTAAATTGSALTEMSITLPVASNFAASSDAFGSGTVSSAANGQGFTGRVFGSAANDNVVFAWRPTNTNSLDVNFSFSYKIL